VHEPLLTLACSPDNDLLRILPGGHRDWAHARSAAEAIERAAPGGGVLLLADNYPEATTPLEDPLLAAAAGKDLRLYVEYPSHLPGVDLGPPRRPEWQRAVIASDAFGQALPRHRILGIHDCHFLPTGIREAHIVLARVAGFDSAVYGLPAETFPLLFEHPAGNVLVATTKLSQFITARYAPADAWPVLWRFILRWLSPRAALGDLPCRPAVRPTYGGSDNLPGDAETHALRRGTDWFFRSRLLVEPSWEGIYDLDAASWADRVGPAPAADLPSGSGRCGILEGYSAQIRSDGGQPVRWWRRSDCNGEVAGALALAGHVLPAAPCMGIGRHIADYILLQSSISQGKRADPGDPAYGLLDWDDAHDAGIYYGDDNARAILGFAAMAALTGSDRHEERLLQCLLANLRTTGPLGFRVPRIEEKALEARGWLHYWRDPVVYYGPHYVSYLWACFLWAYRHTGFTPFLDRARTAIRMTMEAYPGGWTWTNGFQQERARMLLPLAWLVRVENTPEHRGWLRRIADDLLACQDACGAIREELGPPGRGRYAPPATNEDYGRSEAPLIQSDGDSVCDLLYTTNFALLGLHEAAAATGDPLYSEAADRLVKFLCRIQVHSDTRPELHGAWFRAFDFARWDYWASNGDVGWGAWCIETGWTQAWIVAVLALRQMRRSLWDLLAGTRIAHHMPACRSVLLPDDVLGRQGAET
jgi:hypothetical protein